MWPEGAEDFFPRLREVFESLRVRLIIGFVLIVALAVGTVAYIATRSTQEEFSQFLTKDQLHQYNRQLTVLEDYYRENGSWGGVQQLITRLGQQSGDRIVVTDATGMEVGKYKAELFQDLSGKDASWLVSTIMVDSRPVGQLYTLKEGTSEIERTFVDSVQKSVLIAALVAGLTGVVLALFFSRSITKPLKSLTAAARRLKGGDLDKRVEEEPKGEVGELAEAFNSMAEGLQRQEELRQHLVSDVAHELRSPLSNIRGYTESLQKGIIEPDEEVLHSIHEESLALGRLVGDLQDLAQAEAGRLELNRELVAMEDLIERALGSVRSAAEEEGASLEREFLNSETLILEVDPGRIEEVLRNLLENAVRHTPEGGEVKVILKRKEGEGKGKGKALVGVSDTGEGIPQEDLPHIFERFYRVDKSRSRSTGGSGLGLTIARKIVEEHGGEIWAESEEGEGTTFWFSLPVGG